LSGRLMRLSPAHRHRRRRQLRARPPRDSVQTPRRPPPRQQLHHPHRVSARGERGAL